MREQSFEMDEGRRESRCDRRGGFEWGQRHEHGLAAGDGVVSATFSADGSTAAGSTGASAEDGNGCSMPAM